MLPSAPRSTPSAPTPAPLKVQIHQHIDVRHLGAEKIKARLPGVRQIAMDFANVDPVEAPIPVQPSQHYSMGGLA